MNESLKNPWPVPRSRLRRLRSLGPAAAIAVAFAAAGAGVWAQGFLLEDSAATPSALPALPAAGPARELFARCTRAMLRGNCRVMDGSAPVADPSTRVFVAGVGEVDANVYRQLRSQGDAMCGEVQRACETAWEGTACRIAQALYPPLD